MKTNTRILDYVALVQDQVLTVDDVPQDIRQDVIKLVRYFAGIKDDGGVVKDTSKTIAGEDKNAADGILVAKNDGKQETASLKD